MSKYSTVSLVLFVGVLGHRDMGFQCPDNTPTDWTACPQDGLLCSYSGGASGRYACNSWSQWQQLSGGQCLDANGNVFNQGQYDQNGELCLNGNFPSQNPTPAPPTGGCMFYGSSMSVGTQVHGEDIGMGPGCEWARCTSFSTGNRWDCIQFGAAGTKLGAAGIRHQPYRSEKLGTFYKPPPRLAVLGDGDNGRPGDCNYDQCDFFGYCLATRTYAHGGELQNPMSCGGEGNWVVCQFGPNPGTGIMAGAEWQCADSAPAPGAAMADASDATSLGAAGIRHQPYRSEKLGTFYKPPPRLAVLGAAGIRHQPYRSTAVSLGASYPAPRGSGPGITNIPAANTHSSVQDVQGVVVCYTAEGQPRLPTSAVRNANINQLATCIGPQWRYTPLCQIRNQQFCWSNCANNVGATCMNNCACV